jgi:hypothetical protein
MIFTASPLKTAWIHRMVYFPDADIYDLIPEYILPPNLVEGHRVGLLPWECIPYCGAIVQGLRLDNQFCIDHDDVIRDDRGIMEGGMGVNVVMVSIDGKAGWWTVKRNDDEHIGIDAIVL